MLFRVMYYVNKTVPAIAAPSNPSGYHCLKMLTFILSSPTSCPRWSEVAMAREAALQIPSISGTQYVPSYSDPWHRCGPIEIQINTFKRCCLFPPHGLFGNHTYPIRDPATTPQIRRNEETFNG